MTNMRRFMNILVESDLDHREALNKTGFWGAAGAGCVILARDTGRILVAHRSDYVEQPGTWGGWGGAIDRGEDPVEAVKREVSEETGYMGRVEIEPLYVFKKDTFRYFNFLAIVDSEFSPRLDWENQGFKWCDFGDWPEPLHFGLVALFKDSASIETIKKHLPQEIDEELLTFPTMDKWLPADQQKAALEGWRIVTVREEDGDVPELTFIENPEEWFEGNVPEDFGKNVPGYRRFRGRNVQPVFHDDVDLWTYITYRARQGSVFHKKALSYIARFNPEERDHIRRETGH